MKNTKECPKCKSKEIIEGESQNDFVTVPCNGGFRKYSIDYYMCGKCGYIESWKRNT